MSTKSPRASSCASISGALGRVERRSAGPLLEARSGIASSASSRGRRPRRPCARCRSSLLPLGLLQLRRPSAARLCACISRSHSDCSCARLAAELPARPVRARSAARARHRRRARRAAGWPAAGFGGVGLRSRGLLVSVSGCRRRPRRRRPPRRSSASAFRAARARRRASGWACRTPALARARRAEQRAPGHFHPPIRAAAPRRPMRSRRSRRSRLAWATRRGPFTPPLGCLAACGVSGVNLAGVSGVNLNLARSTISSHRAPPGRGRARAARSCRPPQRAASGWARGRRGTPSSPAAATSRCTRCRSGAGTSSPSACPDAQADRAREVPVDGLRAPMSTCVMWYASVIISFDASTKSATSTMFSSSLMALGQNHHPRVAHDRCSAAAAATQLRTRAHARAVCVAGASVNARAPPANAALPPPLLVTRAISFVGIPEKPPGTTHRPRAAAALELSSAADSARDENPHFFRASSDERKRLYALCARRPHHVPILVLYFQHSNRCTLAMTERPRTSRP